MKKAHRINHEKKLEQNTYQENMYLYHNQLNKKDTVTTLQEVRQDQLNITSKEAQILHEEMEEKMDSLYSRLNKMITSLEEKVDDLYKRLEGIHKQITIKDNRIENKSNKQNFALNKKKNLFNSTKEKKTNNLYGKRYIGKVLPVKREEG